ncbi:4-carboxymuconolactone decarboxylase [Aspergillus caelatus]|uniref:4-carboxymuconolactone decarboxylase n=1 Tax=Aspergillus caelatus TaxID=61420 RepID=A0A5N7AE61_9EURO|nr:4-carboxymuconolactone decarboxylase [Aspergillus caelatus]KAE8368122.1 4-carboxymuconolactone decarboxylase [Aspergillus caelatus]
MSKESDLKALHQTLFEDGLKIRRAVVGNAYVERSLANGSSDFARPGQALVTEWCWGHVWARPGLERKQRSLLNLGMLIALKAWPELAVHTRGAINNGLTEKEISEAVLQATIYCGAPAGIEATKVTEKAIIEMIERGEYVRS